MAFQSNACFSALRLMNPLQGGQPKKPIYLCLDRQLGGSRLLGRLFAQAQYANVGPGHLNVLLRGSN
jgi:hypothetical protein